MDEEFYCPICDEELQEIDEDTVKCLNCGAVYDKDDMLLDEDEDSIPDCIWEDMVLSDPDLKD